MLTLNRCPFHPRVTAVARKRPRSTNSSTSLENDSQMQRDAYFLHPRYVVTPFLAISLAVEGYQ